MKTSLLTIGAALVALASATPAPNSPTQVWKNAKGRTVVSYLAKFDDENAGLVPGAPVREITPLGPYDSLNYENMGVIDPTTAVAGINTFSKPNALAYDVVAMGQGPQVMTSKYDDSITDYFNFKSFYFGCVVSTQETAASAPSACSITMTGYRNGRQVATQTSNFQPRGLTANMQMVQLNKGFDEVDTVEFKTNGALQSALLGTLFDNMAYDAVLKPGYGRPL